MIKGLKKNQIAIYLIALMLVTAGYLNYTTNNNKTSVETSIEMESKDDSKLADIGDATLVSSNDVITDTSESQLEENNTVQTNTENADEYFTKSKLERDTMYSQMIETYEKVINSSNSLETQKQSATEEITKINNIKNSIMICENLIKTKGFKNNVIFVNGESVSVIIGTEELKPDEVAQIQNIISREMKTDIENIHIANK